MKLAFTKFLPDAAAAAASRSPASHLHPIVITHGVLGSRAGWSSIAKGHFFCCSSIVLAPLLTPHFLPPALTRMTGRAAYTVDLRNHGDSPHSPEMSHEDMAQDFEQFFEENQIRQPVFIGHSLVLFPILPPLADWVNEGHSACLCYMHPP